MATRSKRFIPIIGCSRNLLDLVKKESSQSLPHKLLHRCQSQLRRDGDGVEEPITARPQVASKVDSDSDFGRLSSGNDDDLNDSKWRLELAWLTKALEPALQLCRWALPTGTGSRSRPPTSSRSVSEILASIQRSKVGIQGWSLSDLTIGFYLIYLRQASTNPFKDIKAAEICSESVVITGALFMVQDLIYHIELAKGSYKDNAAAVAKYSMLRENNIVKFVKNSSVMRPGYYIGVDPRRKLVILGIRGTHTIYDLITDIVTSSDGEVTFDGYSTHFGTAEAARWFLVHEMGTIKKYLHKHEGYRLRLVGHSLGGATAALLAIMLRKKSSDELGFNPDIVSAVGYATPPCVSRKLAEKCGDYVTTVVMQDDIIPRLSVASLMRLRNEILQTDWMNILEKDDWKNVLGLVTNAKQVMTSVQDVARKLADYANFRSKTNSSATICKGSSAASISPSTSKQTVASPIIVGKEGDASQASEELFVPGSVYCLKRNVDLQSESCRNKNHEGTEYFTLWKRHPGEHFQRIILSSNLFSDHKCDSHYHALRDVLKGLPTPVGEFVFR